MGFSDFKKQQQKMKEALVKEALAEKQKTDERFWFLTPDKTGNSTAVIRFLPQQDVTKAPYVMYRHHTVNMNGKWLIENCPYTFKKSCPICIEKNKLWDTDNETAKKLGAKSWFVANILIVEDEAKPENVGKVMLFKFSNLIKSMIDKANNPFHGETDQKRVDKLRVELEDENPKYLKWADKVGNIFDFNDGLNFRFSSTKKDVVINGKRVTVNNYDDSKFLKKPCPVDKSEEVQEEIYNNILDLSEFIDPAKFKTEAELAKRLAIVMNAAAEIAPEPVRNGSDIPEPVIKDAGKNVVSDTDDDIDFDSLMADDDVPF